jgi:hypothetical protein
MGALQAFEEQQHKIVTDNIPITRNYRIYDELFFLFT